MSNNSLAMLLLIKNLILLFSLLFLSLPALAQDEQFVFVEYNVENLFDCDHDSLKDDREFLPTSTRQWTAERMWAKMNRIGKAILSCGEAADTVAIPDLVALCEVENDSVMERLTRRSLLRGARYEYVMTSSPDLRGIDVALLYQSSSFELLASRSLCVLPLPGMRPTRDILYAKGLTALFDTLHVFVVHAPSRSGGEVQTRRFRQHVAETLCHSIDSILALQPEASIIVAGDFNDYNSSPPLSRLAASRLDDASARATGSNGARATYKYQGEWNSLDHIFLSPALHRRRWESRVADNPFLLEKDKTYGGVLPFRTYSGVRYQAGYSDHLPLVVRFF